MRGIYALELRFDGKNLSTAIELFNESIRLDEHYGPAYLALATAYALAHDYYGEPYEEMRGLALASARIGDTKTAEEMNARLRSMPGAKLMD